MNQFIEDLKVLEIDEADHDNVTIRDVIKAFHRKAKIIHPDKAGPEYYYDLYFKLLQK